jgi:malate dehydrogenase
MTVIGAADVEAAAARGTLSVEPHSVVTPLAAERARELEVEIVRQEAPRSTFVGRTQQSAPATDVGTARVPGRAPRSTPPGPASLLDTRPPALPRPPSGALFRRGAPLPPELAAGRQTSRTGRVVVIGAGHVGMIAAMRLADADRFGEVVLVDIDEGRAQGIALDLTHTAALSGFATRVRGVASVEEAGPADYIVLTAGRPRQPGMSRSDLLSVNAAIVGEVAERCARVSPQAVIIVVTNPLDEMTHHAWTRSGFPPERVVGMAGVLDTARFQALAALTGVGRADEIRAMALGSHGEEMVIPLSQASVAGRPLAAVLDSGTVQGLVDRARGSGAEVVGLLKSGSAFMAPGMSAAHMVLAMAGETGEVLPASVLADGSYGIRDVYVGLPVRLGRSGVAEIVEVDLSPDELTALRDAAERIRERVGDLAAAS